FHILFNKHLYQCMYTIIKSLQQSKSMTIQMSYLQTPNRLPYPGNKLIYLETTVTQSLLASSETLGTLNGWFSGPLGGRDCIYPQCMHSLSQLLRETLVHHTMTLEYGLSLELLCHDLDEEVLLRSSWHIVQVGLTRDREMRGRESQLQLLPDESGHWSLLNCCHSCQSTKGRDHAPP
ncbi:hypothetical protein PENTCL1PPCAC_18978, partial [Pristionchus entomophagus]